MSGIIPRAGENNVWNQVSAGAAVCCQRLWEAGYEAYPVGGCVRDLLLGREPGDWDVTTGAAPEQVVALFERTVPTGIQHGTVTVLLEGEQVEVTAFRRELGYADGRHPDRVCFDATLEQDLSRRDFTINAMALGRNGAVIDPFGGRGDLTGRTIRCVGEPERRFSEDALRMFRAVRFAAQLGFQLEPETERAILRCAGGASCLAAERVRMELEKTLCSPRPQMAELAFRFGLMRPWVQGGIPVLAGLDQLPNRPLLRWAGLCAALLRSGSVEDVGAVLTALRLDGRTVRACAAGQELLKMGLPRDGRQWRHALARFGPEGCRAGAAMSGPWALELLERELACEPCVTVNDLALGGGDLVRLGLRGEQIGAAQKWLLNHVLDHPEDNRRQRLLQVLRPDGGEK